VAGTRAANERVRVLGIDPGTLRLGYGVVDRLGPAKVAYVECGVIAVSGRTPRGERLLAIGRELRALIEEFSPDAVAMEQAFFGKNVQSTLALGEARGVALFVAGEQGLAIAGYAPAEVKRAVVGHGRATKDQIAFLVRSLLALRRTPEADAADALAIAVCHARNHGARLRLLTERRPAATARIDIPRASAAGLRSRRG
jgi:crossover junction endodeoxyribonuclease RuvC